MLAAFIAGAATNAIGSAQRINVLYSPVAPLVLWNLVVYALLAAGYVVRYGDASEPGPLRRFVARAHPMRRIPGCVRRRRGAGTDGWSGG